MARLGGNVHRMPPDHFSKISMRYARNKRRCTAPSRTFVRLTAKVNMLTTKVRIRRMVSTASIPSMIVEPVKNPMARTAGIVRLMLASTDPRRIFTERCN